MQKAKRAEKTNEERIDRTDSRFPVVKPVPFGTRVIRDPVSGEARSKLAARPLLPIRYARAEARKTGGMRTAGVRSVSARLHAGCIACNVTMRVPVTQGV